MIILLSDERAFSHFWSDHLKPATFPVHSLRRPLDPRICNIGLDANALDRGGAERDHLVTRFCQLCRSGSLTVVVAGGVRDEIQHPQTPDDVKNVVLPEIFNLRPGLTTSQRVERQNVEKVLQGMARPGKHAADSSHPSEAVETGCGYFITHDKRLLGRRSQLYTVLPPTLNVVTLEEFFAIFDAYETGQLR
jgi:hypothetical protein